MNSFFTGPNSSEEKRNRTKRKFLMETGLNLYSSGATVLRPRDLYQYGKDEHIRSMLEGCNIYLVCRRRRISIDPHTVRVADGRLMGDFRLHGDNGFSYERFSFLQTRSMPGPDGVPLHFLAATCADPFGFNVTAQDYARGIANIPAHVLVSQTSHKLGRHTNLEVLYVGRAWGKTGERLAVDRLAGHSTLQRILAESVEECPEDEILLLLFRYEHSRNFSSTAGDYSVQPSASDAEENAHFDAMQSLRIDRRSRVTLAEAALINYFKPIYNIQHKDSFVHENIKKLKSVKQLFERDLTALIVEISTSNFRSKIYSKNAPARTPEEIFGKDLVQKWDDKDWIRESQLSKEELLEFITDMTHTHIARFPLYKKSERESFLHALPWN